MKLDELPIHRTVIQSPCDVIDRSTGNADRVPVTISIEVPVDVGGEAPVAASFAGIWNWTHFFYRSYEGNEPVDARYLRCDDELFAPVQVLHFRYRYSPTTVQANNELLLAEKGYGAFVDRAKTTNDRDGLLLDWNRRIHALTGTQPNFTLDRRKPHRLDEAFARKYEFDENFPEQVRDSIRRNFLMRPEGLFTRMPLPSWRIFNGELGLDPYPSWLEGWTNSFDIARLDDARHMARHLLGRRAEAAIADPVGSVRELGDLPERGNPDLTRISSVALPALLSEGTPLLAAVDRDAVLAWHAAVGKGGDPLSDADRAVAFLRFATGVEAGPASEPATSWLKRADGIRWRLAELDLPRLDTAPAYAPGPA